jgi:hypothetical protein
MLSFRFRRYTPDHARLAPKLSSDFGTAYEPDDNRHFTIPVTAPATQRFAAPA